MKKKIATVLCSLFLFVACGSSEKEQEKVSEKNHVTIRISQDPDFLDPHKDVASATGEILYNVFEGLVKINSKGELKPALAENYTISDDGLTYEFTVRKGVKFQNGKELTPESVKSSYERFMDKDFPGNPVGAEIAKLIESITISENKIIFKLKQLDGSALGSFTIGVVNDEDGKIYGTGPYIIKEYLPGEHVLLVKNQNYWNKDSVGNIDEAEFKIIKDTQNAVMAFQMGEVDIIHRMETGYVDMIGENGKIIKGEQNLVQLLALNNDVKPLNDIRVRKAINYAVNKEEVIEGSSLGEAVVSGSAISPAVKNVYNKECENIYQFDLNKAKELLTEAGYPNGFEIILKAPSNYQFHVDTAQILKEQLAKAGINVKIQEVEWGTWLSEVYAGKNYEMTIIGFDGKVTPFRTVERYGSKNHRNLVNFKSEEFDKVISKIVNAKDEETRTELYKESQRLLTEGAAAVFIQAPNYIAAVNKNLEGFEIYPVYVLDVSLLNYKK